MFGRVAVGIRSKGPKKLADHLWTFPHMTCLKSVRSLLFWQSTFRHEGFLMSRSHSWHLQLLRRRGESYPLPAIKHHRLILIRNIFMHDRTVSVPLNMSIEALVRV